MLGTIVRPRFRRFFLIALVALVSVPAAAGVGTWRKEGNRRILDFCVSLRFDATAQQIAKIEAGFVAAAPILADVTEDRVHLGNVSILNNSAGGPEAEIWIFPHEDSADAIPNGYGRRGEHIRMYYPSDFDRPNYPIESTAYTIVHELAHQVWGVRDEYKGPDDCCVDTSKSPCDPQDNVCDCEPWPGVDEATHCIMDNYYRRGGNNGSVWNVDPPQYGTFTLNEFCTILNHDPDGDTDQEVFKGQSCWFTMALHPLRRVPAPSNGNAIAVLPDDAPPGGVPDPTFVTLTDQNRFALVIDHSLSMLAQDVGDDVSRLFRAQQAGHILINQMKPDYDLGLIEFSTASNPLIGLTPMTDPNKETFRDEVDLITAAGNTAIGLALIDAQAMIAPPADSCNQPIVLATDGFGNTGPSELTEIDNLVANRIPVTTIAIGSDVNEANLIKLANETGGRYWHVDSAEDLPEEFSFVSADLSGGGVLAAEPGTSDLLPQLHSIDVDDLTEEVTFVLSWSSPLADLRIELISPTTQVLTPLVAPLDPELDFFPGKNQEILRVRTTAANPLVGSWTVQVSQQNSFPTDYNVVVVSDTPEYSLTVMPGAPIYDCGEEMVLHATPQFQGIPLRGVPVSALYQTPSGISGAIAFVDNGDYVGAGDERADDGIYSARFMPPIPAGPGTYSFSFDVQNLNGVTANGEELFLDHEPNPASFTAPPFRRLARLHVPVECTGVLGDCDGDSVVGTSDFAKLSSCFTGQTGTLQSDCECSDLNDDLLVDCVDWQQFALQWGPGGPPPVFPQCMGGEVPQTLQVEKLDSQASRIRLTWDPNCSTGPQDYGIHEGQIGNWYDHTSVTCSTGGATTRLVTTSSGDTYYLVVPNNGEIEGSYGKDLIGGSSSERPVGINSCAPAKDSVCP